MKILSRLFGQRASPENPSTPLSNPDSWLFDALGAAKTDAGLSITPKTALNLSAVFQAVNLLSGDVARLPIHIYRTQPSGGRERDTSHQASYLLRRKPNADMTASVFKRTLTAHALTYGNGYAYIFRDAAARPIELVILLPDRTYPVRENGVLWYVTTVNGQKRYLRAEDVLHIRGLGFDGLQGYSVITLARNSLALGLAAEKFGNKFFSNGSVSSGVITYPGRLKQTAAENLRSEFEEKHQGLEQSHKTILLQEGAKFTPLTIPPEAAQFLGTREFQRREIASWFNLPPHKVGDPARTSFASLEQENQSYLDGSLDPWLQAWEDECFDKLLTEDQKRSESHYVEFNRAALLRTDLHSRYAAYAIGRNWGWLSPDDVRRFENLDPLPDGQGSTYLIPGNMIPADQAGKQPAAAPTRQLAEAHRAMLVDVLARMYRRLAETARRHAKHADFIARMDEALADYEPVFVQAIAPAVSVLRITDDTLNPARIARQHVDAIRRQLQTTDPEATAAAWETNGAETLASQILGALN